MAANITVTSATVAATAGTPVDVVHSVSGLTVSTGTQPSGYSIKVDGVARPVMTAAPSGDTVRLWPFTPITAGAVVTVSVATTSTLRDASANTIAAGQTDRPVTNSSTATAADETAALMSLPAASLDAWYAARDAAAAGRVEVVVFGDSTTHGAYQAGVGYSWVHKVRELSVAAGFADGGRGLLSTNDSDHSTIPVEPVDVADNCVKSRTGWAANLGLGALSLTEFRQDTLGGSNELTLRGYGTAFRIFYTRYNDSSVFSYAIDGGAKTYVNDALVTYGPVRVGTILVTGLASGYHEIQFVNESAGIITGPAHADAAVALRSTYAGSGGPAAGTYYYVMTAVSAAGESTAGPVCGPVTLNGSQKSGCQFRRLNGWTSVNLYRSTSASGPFGLVKTMSVTGVSVGLVTQVNDDASATPGAAPPGTSTLGTLSTAVKAAAGVDVFYDTGVVYHRNAESGATFTSYDFYGSTNGYPGHHALGVAEADSAPYAAAARPPARVPVLSVNALGINNQQSGQTDTTPVTSGLDKWLALTDAAGAIPLRIIPHYGRSASPHTAKAFIDADKAWCATNGVPWFSFDVALDLADFGVTAADPHLNQTGYNAEAQSVWDNALGVTSSGVAVIGGTVGVIGGTVGVIQ